MSLQIAQIKDEFKAAKITELSFVITKHIEDHREGVQALIQSANKKIYAFEQKNLLFFIFYLLLNIFNIDKKSSSVVIFTLFLNCRVFFEFEYFNNFIKQQKASSPNSHTDLSISSLL